MTFQPKHSPAPNSVDSHARSMLEFIEWLSSDDCRGLDEIGFVAETASRLRQIGLPVDRLVLHQMTLHPDFAGRTIAWAPGEPIEVYDSRNGNQLPVGRLRKTLESGELLTAPPDSTWEELDIYNGRSLSQLILAPMMSVDGLLGVLIFGTSRKKGFGVGEAAMLERFVPSLRSSVELKILRQTELGLLDAHIGAATAGRVLARRLRRHEVETLEGAMLLCSLSPAVRSGRNSLSSELAIDAIDRARSMVLSAAKGHGAEIIDLSADRILALYPAGERADVSERAFASAAKIMRESQGVDVDFSLSGHYGELTYGTVGSLESTRLAVVGPDFEMLHTMTQIRRSNPSSWTASQTLLESLRPDVRAQVSGVDIVDTDRLVGRSTANSVPTT